MVAYITMWRWSCWLIVIMLIFESGSKMAESMRFDMHSGETKCISEDVKADTMSVGSYSIVDPIKGDPNVTVRFFGLQVTSPHGVSYHYGDKVEKGTFAFTASENGPYSACFWSPLHKPPLTTIVEFDWRSGVEARDWSNVAKKGNIEAMEIELRKLSVTVRNVHAEMYYLRDREEEMQELNLSTNSEMAIMGFLSLVVCVSVAGLQSWHLRNYFERKKLL
ncbi:unnamed protein product [Linum tenue]|uniref:GOLD domain-containing protein n=1 Tax=Linum tenue TaxID=586396 RepID=A0AAV0N6X5_9ROSI|nr:unnamed protein product [Linum tenue]